MAFNFDEFAARSTPQTPSTTGNVGKFDFNAFANQAPQTPQTQQTTPPPKPPVDIENELSISTEVSRLYSQNARMLRDARRIPEGDPRKQQMLDLVEANNKKAEEFKTQRDVVAKEPGFLQGLAQSVAKPFLKTAATVQGLGTGAVGLGLSGLGALTGSDTLKSAGSRALQEGAQSKIDLGAGFEARPVGTQQETGEQLTAGEGLLDAIGTGLEIGSYAVGGGIPARTFGSRAITAGVQGAKEGAIAGTMGGLGTSLQGGDTSFGRSALGTIAGGLGGAVLGGAVGAGIGKLSSRPLQSAEKEIVADFTRAIKPSMTNRKTPILAEKYDKNVVSAIDTIVDNRGKLTFKDSNGAPVTGRLPETVDEFNQALTQTKKSVYEKYNVLTTRAGKNGAEIDLNPIARELDNFASDPIITDNNPEIAKYAKTRAESFAKRGTYGVIDAQRAVENYNQSLTAFYRNPTYDSASKAAVDALIVNRLRDSLDTVISSATGTAYKPLKAQYAALKAIEADLQRAVNRIANRNSVGLIDYFGINSAGDLANALTSMSPQYMASAAAQQGIIRVFKYLTNPDRITKNLFNLAENSRGLKGTQSILEKGASKVQSSRKVLNDTAEMVKKNETGGITLGDNPLIQEARKYKSAEEFVKAQGEPIYHGTTAENASKIEQGGFKIMDTQRNGRYSGDGVYFAPESNSVAHFGGEKGKVIEAYINQKNFKTVFIPEGNIDWQPGNELVNEWKRAGYDGIVMKLRDTDSITGKVMDEWVNEIVSFKPDQIKTKSQLTDIWNKANKK